MSIGISSTYLRRIDLPDGPVSVAIMGPDTSPTLMLGHALGTDHRMWQSQIASLAGPFRVIAPDFRGHGGSRNVGGPWSFRALAADCAAVAAALGCGPFSYAGLSLGGVVGMELALGWPHLVERLVLCNTRCEVDEDFADACIRRAAAARRQGMTALLEPTMERWLPAGFLQAHPPLAALFREMFEGTRAEPYAAFCEELGRLDISRRLSQIACRTLIIGGAEDHTTPPQVIGDIAAHIRGAETMMLADAAHFPNLEKPEQFTALIGGFLTHHPVRGG